MLIMRVALHRLLLVVVGAVIAVVVGVIEAVWLPSASRLELMLFCS